MSSKRVMTTRAQRRAAKRAGAERHEAARPVTRLGRRIAVAAAVAVVLAGVVLYALGWPDRLIGGPEVVLLADRSKIDPRTLALIDEHVASVRQSPRSADAHGDLGLVYEANGFWDEAVQSFANAEGLAAEPFPWSYHRAIAMREGGDLEGAFALLGQLANRRPDFPPVQHMYGECLLELDEVDAAGAAFQRVIALAPTSPLGFVGLGEVKLRQHQYAEAARLLEKAVTIDPKYKVAHYSLGLAYRGLGRREDAKRELSQGEDARRRFMRDPLWTRLLEYKLSLPDRSRLFRYYVDTGKLDRAREVVEDALKVWPEKVALLHNLAAVHMEQNHPRKAMAVLLRAKKVDERNAGTYSRLAKCSLMLNRLTEAASYARRSADIGPADSRSHAMNAEVFIKLERYEDALASLKAASALDPRNAKLFFNRGEMCAHLQRWAQAQRYFEKAAALEPRSLSARVNSAMMSLKLGWLDKAEVTLAGAAELAPGDPTVTKLRRQLDELRNR